MNEGEEWGLYIEVHRGYKRSFKIVMDDYIIHAALKPWHILAMVAEELQLLFPETERAQLGWHVAHVCRIPGETGFSFVGEYRAFMCGRGHDGDPLLECLKEDAL